MAKVGGSCLLRDRMVTLKAVGYWYDPDVSLSGPDPSSIANRKSSKAEAALLAGYLRSGFVFRQFMGYSRCRLKCGIPDREMGDADLTDGHWCWPEGLAHYVEAHSIRLPDTFLRSIRGKVFQMTSSQVMLDPIETLVDPRTWETWAKKQGSWKRLTRKTSTDGR